MYVFTHLRDKFEVHLNLLIIQQTQTQTPGTQVSNSTRYDHSDATAFPQESRAGDRGTAHAP